MRSGPSRILVSQAATRTDASLTPPHAVAMAINSPTRPAPPAARGTAAPECSPPGPPPCGTRRQPPPAVPPSRAGAREPRRAGGGRRAGVVVEGVEQVEAGARAVDHRDRDRAVERHHRAGRDPVQQLVQRSDLGPVGIPRGRCLVVHRRDRGLHLVRPDGGGPRVSVIRATPSSTDPRTRACGPARRAEPATRRRAPARADARRSAASARAARRPRRRRAAAGAARRVSRIASAVRSGRCRSARRSRCSPR